MLPGMSSSSKMVNSVTNATINNASSQAALVSQSVGASLFNGSKPDVVNKSKTAGTMVACKSVVQGVAEAYQVPQAGFVATCTGAIATGSYSLIPWVATNSLASYAGAAAWASYSVANGVCQLYSELSKSDGKVNYKNIAKEMAEGFSDGCLASAGLDVMVDTTVKATVGAAFTAAALPPAAATVTGIVLGGIVVGAMKAQYRKTFCSQLGLTSKNAANDATADKPQSKVATNDASGVKEKTRRRRRGRRR